ncbi:MAG: hypothetical protein AB199_00795 [Parcubacteria bacterium C7867-004]|nr:MAG: hypothetical protein AB199_00795 [Parcubacteria bacterium C7867-004]
MKPPHEEEVVCTVIQKEPLKEAALFVSPIFDYFLLAMISAATLDGTTS